MYFILYLVLINFIAFFVYMGDKKASIHGYWRTSEASLHFIALIGGSIGALFSCYYLRHKIKKSFFMDLLYLILGLQIVLLGFQLSGLFNFKEFIIAFIG